MSYESYKITSDMAYAEMQARLRDARASQGVYADQFISTAFQAAFRGLKSLSKHIADKISAGGHKEPLLKTKMNFHG